MREKEREEGGGAKRNGGVCESHINPLTVTSVWVSVKQLGLLAPREKQVGEEGDIEGAHKLVDVVYRQREKQDRGKARERRGFQTMR